MDRVRRAGQAALLLLVVGSLAAVRPSASTQPEVAPAAAVSWPTSTLVVSEVQTGGASASDEYAEISNAGPVAVDLTGYELVVRDIDRQHRDPEGVLVDGDDCRARPAPARGERRRDPRRHRRCNL